MEPTHVTKIKPETPVWVWVVRMGKGGWWPGKVESISHQDRLPLLEIKFECHKFRDGKWNGPREIGITTARMRYVELRDPHVKAIDQPHFTPTPLIEKEEQPDPTLSDMSELPWENSPLPSRKGIFRRPKDNSSVARFAGSWKYQNSLPVDGRDEQQSCRVNAMTSSAAGTCGTLLTCRDREDFGYAQPGKAQLCSCRSEPTSRLQGG